MLKLKKNCVVPAADAGFGSVDMRYSLAALKATKLSDMYAKGVESKAGADYQMRNIETGEDRYGLTKAYPIGGDHPSFSIFIADVGEGRFMLTQGMTDDWEGRYAFVVTQEELDTLLA